MTRRATITYWVVVSSLIVLIAGVAAIILTEEGSKHATYGTHPAVLAERMGCSEVSEIIPYINSQAVDCTIGGDVVEVATYDSAVMQVAVDELLSTFAQGGPKFSFVRGDGWSVTSSSGEPVQAALDRLGGKVVTVG